MALSARDVRHRIIDAARTPEWSLGLDRGGAVMATRDSGVIGVPWAVMGITRGAGMRVSLYRPGDDYELDGEVIGEISGSAREMGRQLRHILEDLNDSLTSPEAT